MFAAGNGGVLVKDSCAFNGYVNSIYTIAMTGIRSDGNIPVVGERCAGIVAVTYTRDIFGAKEVVGQSINYIYRRNSSCLGKQRQIIFIPRK